MSVARSFVVLISFLLSSFTATTYGGTKLGVGVVVDSATNLSRSFALVEVLNKYSLANEKDTLEAVLTEYYPFSHAFGITGIFKSKTCDFKIYKQGRKYKEVTSPNNWRDIYRSIAEAMSEAGYKSIKELPKNKALSIVLEGNVEKLGEGSVSEYLPGSMVYEVQYTPRLDSIKEQFNIKYWGTAYKVPESEPYKSVKYVYGGFSKQKDTDLFFFRNNDVPEDLQSAIEPLIYPRYNSLHPTLIYLANGYLLSEKDPGASINVFYSSIISSNRLIASRYDKAIMRGLIFAEISSAYQSKKPHTSDLFSLAASLNRAYSSSKQGIDERAAYLSEIRKLGRLAADAESSAKKIRSAKRSSALIVAGAAANATQAVDAGNKAGLDAANKQAKLTMDQYSKQTREASKLLERKFADIDEKIQASTFIIDNDLGFMSPIATPEIYYFLKLSPQSSKSALEKYAADKPKLKEIIADFYKAPEELREVKVEKFAVYFGILERQVINSELRGMPVSISNIENDFRKGEPKIDETLAQRQREILAAKELERQRKENEESGLDENSSPKILFIVNLKSKLLIDGKLKAILEPGKPNKLLVNPGEIYVEIVPPFDQSKKLAEVVKTPQKGEQAVKKYDFPESVVKAENEKLATNPSIFDSDMAVLLAIEKQAPTKPQMEAKSDMDSEVPEVLLGRWVRKEGERKMVFKTIDIDSNSDVVGDNKYKYKLKVKEEVITFNKIGWKNTPATIKIISDREITVTERFGTATIVVAFSKE